MKWMIAGCILFLSTTVCAGEDDEKGMLFRRGIDALNERKSSDAIATFEAMADRGFEDPAISFDRAIAYAMRVRDQGGEPGDLGRAVHGFEEAHTWAEKGDLVREAEQAIDTLRGELVHRRAQAGETIELARPSFAEQLAHVLPEKRAAKIALTVAFLVAAAFWVRRRCEERHVRIGALVVLVGSFCIWIAMGSIALWLRNERITRRYGVVVAPSAHLSTDRGVPLSGRPIVHEAGKVELLQQRGGWVEIRFGSLSGWVPSSTIRPLALFSTAP